MSVDGFMLAVALAWMVLMTAIHLLALRFWPTRRPGLRAVMVATLLAPGIVGGLDMLAPVPASFATAFWLSQLPGTGTEIAWNAGSWFLAVIVLIVTGRAFSRWTQRQAHGRNRLKPD